MGIKKRVPTNYNRNIPYNSGEPVNYLKKTNNNHNSAKNLSKPVNTYSKNLNPRNSQDNKKLSLPNRNKSQQTEIVKKSP